jgi:hypothetical protein
LLSETELRVLQAKLYAAGDGFGKESMAGTGIGPDEFLNQPRFGLMAAQATRAITNEIAALSHVPALIALENAELGSLYDAWIDGYGGLRPFYTK